MSERPLTAQSQALLSNMIDGEIAETLTRMAAAGGTTNGSKLAMLCYAMARILQKFEAGCIAGREFSVGDVVAIDTRTENPVRVVGYDDQLGKWVLSLDGQYRAWCGKDMRKAA